MAPGIYSVGQVNRYIKNMFTQDYALRKIYVRGEISNLKYHTSGHIYFTLKDEQGILNAVMFRSSAQGLKVRLQNGMRVVAGGSINIYEDRGTYQMYVQVMEPDGKGALAEAYEKLKTELAEMGVFAEEYKQPVPKYARRIGIVTASTGAAIRDICNITARRNPCVTLYLYPALVQGANASASIVAGIETLDEMGLDVIIVGRGGGSIEDLWAFNERETAMAIFNASTPIISAVGHETDVTIADFVADLRAPTPSAAAELAVFDYEALMEQLSLREDQLDAEMAGKLEEKHYALEVFNRRLQVLNPENQLAMKKQQFEMLKDRLNQIMDQKILGLEHRFSLDAGKLELLSPLKRLSGGFAYVQKEDGHSVGSAGELEKNQVVRLQFSDGTAMAEIQSVSVEDGNNQE